MSTYAFALLLLVSAVTISFVHTQGVAVPSPNKELIKVVGLGTQNYICKSGAWTFTDPVADLFKFDDPSVKVGKHFFNPAVDAQGGKIVFEVNGSAVTFKPVTTSPSKNPNSIPEVLLSTTNTTPGTLKTVTFGQRLETLDGIAPKTPCAEGQVGKIPYRAIYAFFSASGNAAQPNPNGPAPTIADKPSVPTPTIADKAPNTPPSTPSAPNTDINVPSPNVQIIKVLGKGTQNYLCTNGSFVFQNPTADLFQLNDQKKKLGNHFFNPNVDGGGGKVVFVVNGSAVTLKGLRTKASPNANSIPEVLLEKTGSKPGTLGGTTFAQRLNTFGGLAPAGACKNGDVARVPYTADYAFFGLQGNASPPTPNKPVPTVADKPAAPGPTPVSPPPVANPGANLQKFTEALFGVSAPQIVKNGAGFDEVVNGRVLRNYRDLNFALRQSCNTQHFGCRRSPQGGSGAGETQCNDQRNKCRELAEKTK